MPTTPSTQRGPQPSPRKRAAARPAAGKRGAARPAAARRAAAKLAAAKPAALRPAVVPALPLVTSGVAYFTFSNTGEIIITSHELALALRNAGGRAFVDGGNVKIGVYAGARLAAAPGRGERAKNVVVPATGRRKAMAAGDGSGKGYLPQDNPGMDSMCTCDVKC